MNTIDRVKLALPLATQFVEYNLLRIRLYDELENLTKPYNVFSSVDEAQDYDQRYHDFITTRQTLQDELRDLQTQIENMTNYSQQPSLPYLLVGTEDQLEFALFVVVDTRKYRVWESDGVQWRPE